MIELVDEKDVKTITRNIRKDKVKRIHRKDCINDVADTNNLGFNLQNTIKKINYKELKIVKKELKLMEEQYVDRWMNMKWNLK